MSIVNFSIPKTLERQVSAIIKQKGFASKAEFFRVAAMRYVAEDGKSFRNEDERMDYLVKKIDTLIREKFKNKKLPSAREQLKNL